MKKRMPNEKTELVAQHIYSMKDDKYNPSLKSEQQPSTGKGQLKWEML